MKLLPPETRAETSMRMEIGYEGSRSSAKSRNRHQSGDGDSDLSGNLVPSTSSMVPGPITEPPFVVPGRQAANCRVVR